MSCTPRSRPAAALALLCLAALAWSGCSTAPTQHSAEAPEANCFNACANQFALCTEESGGDFADCSRQRNECRTDCEAQQMERDDEQEDVFLEGEPAELEGPGTDVDEEGE